MITLVIVSRSKIKWILALKGQWEEKHLRLLYELLDLFTNFPFKQKKIRLKHVLIETLTNQGTIECVQRSEKAALFLVAET